jgi:hypothetical protein
MKLEALTGIIVADYMVCDRCGYLWDIDVEWPDPIICPHCENRALWRYGSLPMARQASFDIQNLVDTGTPLMDTDTNRKPR